MACPNISSPEWKALVNVVGVDAAWDLWKQDNSIEFGKSPSGRPSSLLDSLKTMNPTAADRLWATAYSKEFLKDGDWTKGERFSVDKDGDLIVTPSVYKKLLFTYRNTFNTNRDINEEIEHVKKLLPGVPVNVLDTLVMDRNGKSYGKFHNDVMTISNIENRGQAYHEAFHAVTNLYLNAGEKALLFNQSRDVYGNDVSVSMLEELLADEFSDWMSTQVEVPSMFKKLFDYLKQIINYFKGDHKSKIFNKIKSGAFTATPILTSDVTKYNMMQLDDALKQDAVAAIFYQVVDKAGFLDLDNEAEIITSSEDIKQSIIDDFATEYENAFDKGDHKTASSFELILYNFDDLWKITRAELKYHNLTWKSDEDANDREESHDLGIKNSLLYSGKDNATGNVKLLIATLVSTEVSLHTGLKKLADFDNSWKTLAENLSGITDAVVDINGVPTRRIQSQRMKDKVFELSDRYPQFKSLYAKLNDPNYPDYKKIQFYTAFSKHKNKFTNSVYWNRADGRTYEYMDADQQTNKNKLINDWKENIITHLEQDGDSKHVLIDGFNGVINWWTGLKSGFENNNITREKQNAFLEEHSNTIYASVVNQLSKIGVEITSTDLKDAIPQMNPSVDKPDAIGMIIRLVGQMKEFNTVFTKASNENAAMRTLFIQSIAYAAAMNSEDGYTSSVLGPDGKMYQSSTEYNYITKQVDKWKDDPSELIKRSKMSFYKNSQWLPNKKQSFKLRGVDTFLTHKVANDPDSGTASSELSPPDELIERMNRMLDNHITNLSNQFSYYAPLTFADKSSFIYMKGPGSTKFTEIVNESGIDKFRFSSIAGAPQIFRGYFLDEYHRVIEYYKKGHYDFKNDPMLKIHAFPELSYGTALAKELNLYDFADNVSTDLVSVRENLASINKYMETMLKKNIGKQTAEIKKYDLIDENGKIKGLNNAHYNKVPGAAISDRQRTSMLISDFTINSMIGMFEHTKLFTGDPAFYKDMPKRTPAGIGTGQDSMSLEEDGKEVESTFQVAVLSDSEAVNGSGTYYQTYLDVYVNKFGISESVAKGMLAPYRNNNKADAQGLIRPERFRRIMRGQGKWNREDQEAYENLMSGDLKRISNADLHRFAQPLKGMHYELRPTVDGLNIIPTFLKYSQATLWPSLVKGTDMEKIYNTMQKQGIDEVVFESGVKVGGTVRKPSFQEIVNGTSEFEPFTLRNEFWKLQNELPSKYWKKGKTLEGSQMKKNILANIKLDDKVYSLNGESYTGREIYDRIVAAESALSDIGFNDLLNELGIEKDQNGKYQFENTGMQKLRDKLIEQYKDDGVSDNIIMALDNGIPLDALFQFRIKNEERFTAMITKASIKLDMPGGAFIQLSNEGFNKPASLSKQKYSEIKNDIIWLDTAKEGDPLSRELHGPRWNEATQRTDPGEILLPYKVVEMLPGIENMKPEEIANALNDSGLLEGIVGYRIPNQGLSSIDTLKIVGILPVFMGDTMVTYTEITGKTGADFDIDKMYIELPNSEILYDYKGLTKKYIETNLDTAKALNTIDKSLGVIKRPEFSQVHSYANVFYNLREMYKTDRASMTDNQIKFIEDYKKFKEDNKKDFGKLRRVPSADISSIGNDTEYTFADFAKDNKGKSVTVTYEKYKNSFTAIITGEIETTLKGQDEKGSYKRVDIQAITSTGKLITVNPFYEIKGDLVGIGELTNDSDLVRENVIKKQKVSKAGLQNLKLDLYNAILQSEDKFVELTTPLDAVELANNAKYLDFLSNSEEMGNEDWIIFGEELKKKFPELIGTPRDNFKSIQRKILSLETFESTIQESKNISIDLADVINKFQKKRGLDGGEFYTPFNQIKIKTQNMAGKSGTGQTSNHLTNHPICQIAGIKIRYNLGLGNMDAEGNMDISKEFSYDIHNKIEGEQITKTLSGFLNAYVDCAKDPYIALINNNTKTAGIVFLMIRAGVPLKYVNTFISQPILKDWVAFEAAKDSKILTNSENVDFKNGVKSSADRVINKYGITSDMLADTMRLKDLTLTDLENQITMVDARTQAVILKEFLDLRAQAKTLSNIVKACKTDVDGVKSRFNNAWLYQNLVNYVKNTGDVINFDKLFEKGTHLHNQNKNSVDFANNMPAFQISQTKMFRDTFSKISRMLGDETVSNQELLSKVEGAFYAYTYSGADLIAAKPEELKKMFYSKESIANRVAELKIDPAYSSRPFIKQLSVQFGKNGDPNFISVFSSKTKNRKYANDIWKDWNKMLISDNEEEKVLAQDLIKMAFYTSGFQKSLFSFFDSIPTSYMMNSSTGETFGNYLERMTKKMENGGVSETFIEQFFQHNTNDKKLVPNLKLPDNTQAVWNTERTVLQVPVQETDIKNRVGSGLMPYAMVQDKVMKLAGYTNLQGDIGIYVQVPKLGFDLKGKKIYEYAAGKNITSIIHGNRNDRGVINMEAVEAADVNSQFLKHVKIGNGHARLTDFNVTASVDKVDDGFQVILKDLKGNTATVGPVSKTSNVSEKVLSDFLKKNTNSIFTSTFEQKLNCFGI